MEACRLGPAPAAGSHLLLLLPHGLQHLLLLLLSLPFQHFFMERLWRGLVMLAEERLHVVCQFKYHHLHMETKQPQTIS